LADEAKESTFEIKPLESKHDQAAFSCGVDSLDVYLQRKAGQDLKKHAAVSFVYLGPPSIGDRLSAFGFFHRPEEAKIVVFRPRELDKKESERLLRRESWFLTEADRDV